ncbi:MAG: DUF370 domain-containing protein [Desulfovibrionaceae bacterium]|nr:DUF370 domain-containing protein [Desulfovibrionaceae bacterium]
MPGHMLVNVGFGNYVLAERVIAIVNPVSSPMRRLREDAKAEGRLVDASHGRKTRSIVVTDSNHVILSAISADTLGQRFTLQQHAGSDISDETESDHDE